MLSPVGRVILISGANRGIGLAVAEHLYGCGFTLSLGVRDQSSMAGVVGEWDPNRVLVHNYDAEDHATHQHWVEATIARFDRIDGLINNAGIEMVVDLEDEDDTDLDRLWAINVKGPLSMTRKAMPHLRRCGSGRVINLASIAGKAVFGSAIGYSMSKFSLLALSHATRHAGWEDGVRCTALCPGYVKTDMTADVETMDQELMITTTDIAELVVTVMGLSNKASVAELIVNCRNDVSM